MRNRLIVLLYATGALVGGPAAAQAQSGPGVERGPVPAWATPSEPLPVPADAAGLAFIRQQDLLLHLDEKGQSTYVAQRIVLLHPQALQFGNIGLSWNPAAGTPVVHSIRVHRPGETIDVLETTAFEILRREDQLEQSALTGTLTAVLRIPDVRVGDELEFAYTLPTGDPTLRDQNATVMGLGGNLLPGRYRLGVTWVDGQEPRIRSSDDLAAATVRSASGIDMLADNPPVLVPPTDAPPRYAWQRVIEVSDFPSWSAVSKRFSSLFSEAAKLSPSSPLQREVERIEAAHPGALDRAQAALALVQQQVRYVYVGLDGGNFRPATAEETWQRRYGDCKAKTAMLLALLGEMGIRAEPVLVRNSGSDDGFDARLPNPSLFDHVLVRATIDGKSYWLDGTLPVVATANSTPDFPYRWVLPLLAAGSDLEQLAWQPPSKPNELHLYEIDARAGLDAPARIVTTSIKRGPEALIEYMQLSALTQDQMLQAFRSGLSGESSWNAIESVKYRFDVAERAGILEIAGAGPVDWDIDDDGTRSLSLPGGGFIPPSRRQRPADQDQSAPFYTEPAFSCHVTTVRLPAETDAENWSHNTTFDTQMFGRVFYRMFDQRDDSVRMVRGSRTELPEIDPTDAERDNRRLVRFDNSMARLDYDPRRRTEIRDSRAEVPATYEIDWVSSPEACLPADMRSVS